LITALLLFIASSSVAVAEENPQCELIANLTGDYFSHKQAGISKQETIQTLRPDFGSREFLRTVDLAIDMAYTFPFDTPEEEVEQTVYESCIKYQ
jgi:hypothetical protein